MDKWQRDVLICNRVELVKNIQLDSTLYSSLRAKGIIGKRQEERWKHSGCMEAQVEELLDHLARRPPQEYWQFIDALKSSHPSHKALVDNIQVPPQNRQYNTAKSFKPIARTASETLPVGSGHQSRTFLLKELLAVNKVALAKSIHLSESLYNQLRSRGIIGWEQEQQLRSLPSGPFQIKCLFSLVEQVPDDSSLARFCEALSTCQPSQSHLVELYLTLPSDGASNIPNAINYMNGTFQTSVTGTIQREESGINESQLSISSSQKEKHRTHPGQLNSTCNGVQETGQLTPIKTQGERLGDYQESGQWNIELLTTNRIPLVEGMNISSSGLYTILRSKRIIGMREEQAWRHLGADESQVEALLDYITNERPDAFPDFCEALISCRPSQKHLVDMYLTDTPGIRNGHQNTSEENPSANRIFKKRKSDDSVAEEMEGAEKVLSVKRNLNAAPGSLMAGLEDLVTCPICLETLQSPKGLPCQHNFCLSCLRDHVQANHVAGSSQQFLCPVCRSLTLVPERGVAYFPNALAVQNMLALL